MLELLMVIFILGIAAAVLVPQLNSGAEQAKLVTAARSVVQASRYARTMALLHQSEIELAISSASGTVEVRAKNGGTSIPVQQEELLPSEIAAADESSEDGSEEHTVDTRVAADKMTAQSFAEEVNQKFEVKEASFEFLGYTDNVDNDSENGKKDSGNDNFSLTFNSNGTCRPFKLKVFLKDDPDSYYEVTVDVIGKAKIEGYGDDE